MLSQLWLWQQHQEMAWMQLTRYPQTQRCPASTSALLSCWAWHLVVPEVQVLVALERRLS